MRRIRVAVLGATGSIGRQTIDVLKNLSETHEAVLLANRMDAKGLDAARAEFRDSRAYVAETGILYRSARDFAGVNAPGYLNDPESYRDVDLVVNGIAGMAGIRPSVAALTAGKTLATANKESLVCFGRHLKELERRFGGKIVPVDSEHSAILQCLGEDRDFDSLTITASGGAFRDLDFGALAAAKASDALRHPNWVMGKKVTIDCATMVNKAFELAEAAVLFETTDVAAILHRESIVHAFCTMRDGSVKASMNSPDMRIPIQFALTAPKRVKSAAKPLNLADIRRLTFAEIDKNRYPAYAVLKDLPRRGEAVGTVAVAADEVLVAAYLENRIGYFDFAEYLDRAIHAFSGAEISTVADVFSMEREVTAYITSMIPREVSTKC